MDDQEIRMRVLETYIPTLSRNGLTQRPDEIIEACGKLEKYVLGSQVSGESMPKSPPQPVRNTPRKSQRKNQSGSV